MNVSVQGFVIMFEIECPHCKKQQDTTDWTEHWKWDGDNFDLNCTECEKEMSIKVSVDVEYTLLD